MAKTLQQVADIVRGISGDTSAVMVTDTRIAQWASLAQVDILKKTETAKSDVAIVSVAGTNSYPVAGGFLSVDAVYYDGMLCWRRSKREIDYQDRYRLSINGATGPSKYYWLTEDTLNLYPTPDVSGLNVIVSRVPKPVDLVNMADLLTVPDETFEQVIEFCLQKAKEQDEDYQAASWFKTEYKEKVNESAYEEQMKGTDSYPVVRDAPGESW